MNQLTQAFASIFSAKRKRFLAASVFSLGLPFQVFAQSPMVYQAIIDTADGTRFVETIQGFSVGLAGEEPSAALLLPAVSAARETARPVHKASRAGETLPVIIIEGSEDGAKPLLRIELKDVMITSYSLGGSADDTGPVEEFTLVYGEVQVTYHETETYAYDCRAEICMDYGHAGF
jgi:hypothetical protein